MPKGLDPNKGFGRPGSLRFHKLTILSCETVGDVAAYVFQVTGKKFDPLKVIQRVGIKLIEDNRHDKG